MPKTGFTKSIRKVKSLEVMNKIIYPDGTEQASAGFVSVPPSGKHKVINIYWDPSLEKVVVEKLSEPEP